MTVKASRQHMLLQEVREVNEYKGTIPPLVECRELFVKTNILRKHYKVNSKR